MEGKRISVLEHSPYQYTVKKIASIPDEPLNEGDRYIVTVDPEYDYWKEQDNKIATLYKINSGHEPEYEWIFDEPKNGWTVWVDSEDKYFTFIENTWFLHLDGIYHKWDNSTRPEPYPPEKGRDLIGFNTEEKRFEFYDKDKDQWYCMQAEEF